MIFNMTGGGKKEDPLNFQVKTYPSETELKADNPKENTIGVITTTTMTSWVFSAKEPTEPEVGMVWFSVGYSSAVEFNALKENTLQIYLIRSKQYVGGEFVDVTSFIYQNAEWADFIYYLYRSGKFAKELANGFEQLISGTTFLSKADCFDVYCLSNDGALVSPEPIDVTGYTTMSFLGRLTFETVVPDKFYVCLSTTKNTSGRVALCNVPYSTNTTTFDLPLPADGGQLYLCIGCGKTTSADECIRIEEIVLK